MQWASFTRLYRSGIIKKVKQGERRYSTLPPPGSRTPEPLAPGHPAPDLQLLYLQLLDLQLMGFHLLELELQDQKLLKLQLLNLLPPGRAIAG